MVMKWYIIEKTNVYRNVFLAEFVENIAIINGISEINSSHQNVSEVKEMPLKTAEIRQKIKENFFILLPLRLFCQIRTKKFKFS